MKKILGLTALVLIAAVPASAASQLEFILELNGDNNLAAYNAGTLPIPMYVGGQMNDGFVVPASNVLNWDVRVIATGDYNGADILGVANVVFDLVVKKDGVPVEGLGAKIGDTGGFYSNINDGLEAVHSEDKPYGVLYPLLAAFTYSYNPLDIPGTLSANPGRIFDPSDESGPHLARHTYPTAMGYCLPAPPPDRCSTAAGGWLVGMGAGYEQFLSYLNPDPGPGQERPGVGRTGDLSTATPGVCFGLGQGAIAEGQIDTRNLNGTYTLELVAGNGNNVLRGDIPCFAGTNGNFAVKVDSVLNGGDTISFTVNNVIGEKPIFQGAVARRSHGGTPFDIPLNTTGNATVECRNNGPQQLVLTYDKDIAGTPTVNLSAGTLGAVTMSGQELTINLSGVADGTCLQVDVSNVAASVGGLLGDPLSLKVVALFADVNNSRVVNSTDIAIVKSQSGVAISGTNFRNDVNASGTINSADIALVKSRSGAIPAVTCAY
jgi:hypothetical protein